MKQQPHSRYFLIAVRSWLANSLQTVQSQNTSSHVHFALKCCAFLVTGKIVLDSSQIVDIKSVVK